MLPLIRQFANTVADCCFLIGAIRFEGDGVASHCWLFPKMGLNLAPDAATKGEPTHNAKKI